MHGDHAAAGSATKGSAAPPPHARDAERVLEASALHGGVHLISRAGTDSPRLPPPLELPSVTGCSVACASPGPQAAFGSFASGHLDPPPTLQKSQRVSGAGWRLWGRGPSPWAGRRTVEMERSLRESYCEICAVERLAQPRRVGLP